MQRVSFKLNLIMKSLLILCLFSSAFQGSAEAATESKLSKAKGYGFLARAERWNEKYVEKQVVEKNGDQKEVVGFYTKDWSTDNVSHDSLKSNTEQITGVATFTYKINSNGKVIGKAPQKALKVSRENNIETLALVHNLSASGFNRQLIHSILSNPSARSTAISNIYKTLMRNGYDGVNIDFENIAPSDREYLNAFVDELKKKLSKDNLKVTMSVPAKTWDNPYDGWSGAFDYSHLGKAVDSLMLMTYDEHWLGGSPGPVASSPWVEKVAAYSSTVIPKEKILLGMGNYGYDWIVGKGGSSAVPAKKAVPMALNYGADIKWDSNTQTPYFFYWKNSQQHVVWFESTESAAFKLDLVNKYGLNGIAIWKLGFESDSFWDMLEKKFNSSKQ